MQKKQELEALVIKLNTPGGLLQSTRDIVTSILEAKVPVIVYVAPGGARAGSPGVFITLGHKCGSYGSWYKYRCGASCRAWEEKAIQQLWEIKLQMMQLLLFAP